MLITNRAVSGFGVVFVWLFLCLVLFVCVFLFCFVCLCVCFVCVWLSVPCVARCQLYGLCTDPIQFSFVRTWSY